MSAEEDTNALAVRRAQHGRIQEIHEMLVNAVTGEDPPNDGVAQTGMVVTVRFESAGETQVVKLLRVVPYGLHGTGAAPLP